MTFNRACLTHFEKAAQSLDDHFNKRKNLTHKIKFKGCNKEREKMTEDAALLQDLQFSFFNNFH